MNRNPTGDSSSGSTGPSGVPRSGPGTGWATGKHGGGFGPRLRLRHRLMLVGLIGAGILGYQEWQDRQRGQELACVWSEAIEGRGPERCTNE